MSEILLKAACSHQEGEKKMFRWYDVPEQIEQLEEKHSRRSLKEYKLRILSVIFQTRSLKPLFKQKRIEDYIERRRS